MPKSNPKTSVQQQFAAVIEKEAKECGGYKNLSEAIRKANPTKRTIERRKLSYLVKGESVVLSFLELEALDVYLRRHGQGLGSAFSASLSLVMSLIDKRDVAFLMGARRYEKVWAVSHWDVRSMASVLGTIFRTTSGVKVSLHDFPLLVEKDQEKLGPKTWERFFKQKGWLPNRDDPDGPSVVDIGSARSCHATEVMLAAMFGIKPFDSVEAAKLKLPFRFILPSNEYRSLPSSFAIDAQTVDLTRELTQGLEEDKTREVYGIQCLKKDPKQGNKVVQTCAINRTSSPWTTYGIIAAQKQQHGQTWVVISGATALGTLAAARQLEFVNFEFTPSGKRGHETKVSWALIEAEVEGPITKSKKEQADTRELISQRIIYQEG